uniref:Uncharacterized protein n=1 Tax=Arundo donax TaxID=35708 RepID=A0A0A8Y327_ARUDO
MILVRSKHDTIHLGGGPGRYSLNVHAVPCLQL